MKRVLLSIPGWLLPAMMLCLFAWTGADAIVRHDADDALLAGIAIGLIVASLLLGASRRWS